MLDGYEITLIALECLFFIICCVYCHGTEIWIRTSWAEIWPKIDGDGKTALLYAIEHSKRDRCDLFDIVMEHRLCPAIDGTEDAIFVAAAIGSAETVSELLN
jgi:hypothetical protein